MLAWLNLFRWPNMLLIFIAHLLFRLCFLDHFDLDFHLNSVDFFLLSFSIIFIAAAGNIINDIFDIKTDFINKRKRPLAQGQIKVSKAYSLYFILNIIAILISFYISYKLQFWLLFVVEISVILVLYFYAQYLKSIPILGNILVSFLVSLSFVLVLYFDVDTRVFFDQKFFKWILFYAGFAFWANLNREWIKDVMDIKGDYAQGISTLPVLLGKSRMNTLIFGSTLCLILALIVGVKIYFQFNTVFVLYLIFGLCLPLFLVLYHIYKNELNTNYKWLSHLYKVVMLLGVFSLILFRI